MFCFSLCFFVVTANRYANLEKAKRQGGQGQEKCHPSSHHQAGSSESLWPSHLVHLVLAVGSPGCPHQSPSSQWLESALPGPGPRSSWLSSAVCIVGGIMWPKKVNTVFCQNLRKVSQQVYYVVVKLLKKTGCGDQKQIYYITCFDVKKMHQTIVIA